MPLPAAIQDRITPKRKRQGLYLLIAALLYSLLGFLLLPVIIESQLKAFVADKLKLEASVSRIQLNPWNMAVRIDGLKIAEPKGGDTLIAARSIYVRIGVLASVWLRGASVSEVDLIEPYIDAHVRKDGRLNLLQLVPPAGPEPKVESKSDGRWRVGKLGIHSGRIDFLDETRPTPFAGNFAPLNISLENLSSLPNKKGEYALAADTGHGEKLRWHGSLALSPLRSSGHLEVQDLQATTPWSYVQDTVPVIVKTGLIDVAGDYRLTMDQAVDFKLDQGRIGVRDLLVQQKDSKAPLWFALGKLDVDGLQLDWPLHRVGLQSLGLQNFGMLDKPGSEALAKFGALNFTRFDWQAGNNAVSLKKIELDALGLRNEKAAHLFDLPSLVVSDIQAGLAKHTLHIDGITLQDGEANIRVLPANHVDWESSLLGLSKRLASMAGPDKSTSTPTATVKTVAKTTTKKPAKTAAAAAPAWGLSLGTVDLTGFRVNAEDSRFDPAVKIPVRDINLHIKPRLASNQPHELAGGLTLGFGGKLSAKGTFEESPVKTDFQLDISALNIPPLAPYFADIGRFDLISGTLDLNGRARFAQGKTAQASFDGRVAVNKFAANDLDLNQRFLAWNQLAAEGIQFNLSPMQVNVKQVLADQLYTRMIITPDYKLNFQHIFTKAETNQVNPKPVTADNGPGVPVKIGQILVKNSSMLFADLTLKPQFATGIQSLNGSIQNISTDKSVRSTVKLDGRVDQSGTAEITGQLNPLATDVYTDMSVKFGNLELTTFTPYSGKFAGYRIDKGKLSLDLNYKIRNRQLEATNSVVMNQLTLGDKVDSPDAVNLPLKLAVAILKDGNGVINIDLPISGSMDDPKFKVGPIIWKAFVNVLTKVATAPFKFIAGLVGGGDDMDSIAFASGDSVLPASEAGKLSKLATAMKQKAGFRLELRGAYDPRADLQALRVVRFNQEYAPLAANGGKEEKILEDLYIQRVGKEALAELRALNMKPPVDGADAREALALSHQNYVRALRSELAAREVITDGDLRQLALKRANAIRAQVVDQNQVDAARVFVLEPQTAIAKNDQVITTMALNAD
jgi:hypothetical protein